MADRWSLSLWPTRAQFRPGDTVTLTARIGGPAGGRARLHVLVTEGGSPAGVPVDAVRDVEVPSTGEPAVLRLEWPPPETDAGSGKSWRAFGVDACLLPAHDQGMTGPVRAADETGALARASTAFDVASHWSLAPRYGFLADFDPGLTPADDAVRLEEMLRLHLNVVQFYDWMYRHHTYVPPEEVFTDPMGRVVDFGVVRRRLELCRRQGMAPMAYASVYGAEWDLMEDHPDWLLYDGTGEPMRLAGCPFYIQDLSPGCGWRTRLMDQYRQALDLGFVGLHCDAYGSPTRG
ncbi:MAG TPA: hypothetical protein DGR79_01285, partial [Clostridiales bacterium]|nr:hypothetical protein [Clostridiales bacterium]